MGFAPANMLTLLRLVNCTAKAVNLAEKSAINVI
jgi:hypothetical protein